MRIPFVLHHFLPQYWSRSELKWLAGIHRMNLKAYLAVFGNDRDSGPGSVPTDFQA